MAAMTPKHKQALAQGRTDSRAVKTYLEALVATKPRRGRKRSVESMQRRLQEIENTIESAAPLNALHLAQERLDLEGELATRDTKIDITVCERDFVKVAKRYSQSKGISYAAWREAGVQPDVLRKAGITRSQ
jgi:hypothetical protein